MEIDPKILKIALEGLDREIARHDRVPFRRELARMLGIKPTNAALQEWANKYPDKWAQAVTMLANLTGYRQGVDVNLNILDVTQIADADLLKVVRDLSAQVKALARGAAGEVVDVEILPPLLGVNKEGGGDGG